MDKRLHVKRLNPGNVHRAAQISPAPGGKAAHVAMVLKTLGADPLWLGFAGGATGKQLVEGLREMAIRVEAVTINGCVRTNLEIIEEDGRVTEILEPGESISVEELQQFEETMTCVLRKTNERKTVIFSGSLPAGLSADYYKTLAELVHQQGSRVFLDTSGEAFRFGLAGRPEFIKPNREEAESWSGNAIDGPAAAQEVMKAMLKAGAMAGSISLGAAGLVWCSEDGQTFSAEVPKLQIRSCVGSGDATLAGFAFAAEQQFSAEQTVRLAAACGSANCLADGPGRASAEDIEKVKKQIRVESLA